MKGAIVFIIVSLAYRLSAQIPDSSQGSGLEISGFVMTDVIYAFKQADPQWFDEVRPTKLPSYNNQFAPNGQMYFSVRYTRLTVKGFTPTSLGQLKTLFEFDLAGTGVNAGQTTFHLRHAYGELGRFGAGQTWSTFMDHDVLPESLENWGPNGMISFRNVQICFTPLKGQSQLTVAVERPGASADEGPYKSYIQLRDVVPERQLPDVTTHFRYTMNKSYIQLGGILRRLQWKDLDTIQPDLSDRKIGWGLNLSSGLNFLATDKLHLEATFGKGIESYFKDAPVDVGVEHNANVADSVRGVALPVIGVVAFYDHYWTKKLSSTIGYSQVKMKNSNGQSPNSFKLGQYALTNLIFHASSHTLAGVEFQYSRRENYLDGWAASDFRIQLAFKWTFSKMFKME